MLHAPSHFWSCHFPAMAIIMTILPYTLFGAPALLLIVPFFIIYPMLLYGTFKTTAISIMVDNDIIFVRQGLDPEKEYALEKVASFTVLRKNFSKMLNLNIIEWLICNPNHPTKMIIIDIDGRELLLFSYSYGSPLKKSWVKFNKQVEDLTNKHVHLKCDEKVGDVVKI